MTTDINTYKFLGESGCPELYLTAEAVVVDTGFVRLIESFSEKLRRHNLKLCTAESCTGGLLSSLCTSRPGSSRWFNGCVVAYDNSLKINLLGVPPETLAEYGAVSRETARAMAEGALKACGADCAISITGIAGPDGGSADKPVGTVVIGLALPGHLGKDAVRKGCGPETYVFAREHLFHGPRDMVRMLAAIRALQVLEEQLLASYADSPASARSADQ